MAGRMWMVRAGEGGYLVDQFEEKNSVAIGWGDLGDLAATTTQDAIWELYEKTYPGQKPGKAVNAVAVLYKFRSTMKPGDEVVTYDPEERKYLMGQVETDYQWAPGKVADSPHVRGVVWKGRVNRDALSSASRNSLGSTLTLFSISEDTAAELRAVLAGKTPPPGTGIVEEGEEDLEEIKKEALSRAHELIKDKILALNGDELEQLMAAVLRAMGYRARVTRKGPDRGVDVIGSPDGLGLEAPRIKAEVKHRPKTAMTAQDIRGFLGGLREGDRGLYVSTGGFTKDARYEAERSATPVTLIDLDDLANLVVTHYDGFDTEGRVLLPLVKVYWPAE